ncbi:hypothetical protein SA2016_1297 [Sinomonas atrocyanea]|uniref:Uncharacterized protein n=1 Tax=Sinomonas atrocyanea TaxID=37927 RepID=A0A126ZYF7_9MICC|nr:hypothetical protein SA2016_1297 [Sinomonas atrocyanea]GEB65399.1 hypothetical protein SAT01_28470 [Sinomonas atrocyanea]GGG77767.1 hypothetical protein GCM10007172_33440 [Sinomonas atrocyanea]
MVFHSIPSGGGEEDAAEAGDVILSWSRGGRGASQTPRTADGRNSQVYAANDWPIVFADVPARTVVTDGKDLDQYGYAGPPLAGLRDSVAGDTLTS